MIRRTILGFAMLCSLSAYAQTPNFKDFNTAGLVEVGKDYNFSYPTIVGKSGESTFFLQRELKKSGFVNSTLYKIEKGAVVKEIELGKEVGDPKFFVNARIFEGGVLCYGYAYRDKNEAADIIFRIYDLDLNMLGSDQLVASVFLDDKMLPLGVQKNKMTNLGALPVVRANFASEVYPTADGNFEIWMTYLAVADDPAFKKKAKEKTAEERHQAYIREDAVDFHQITFSRNGDLISNTKIPVGADGKVNKTVYVTPRSMNSCSYIKTDEGIIAFIEKKFNPDHLGVNVFDDQRYPVVTIYSTSLLKFENGKFVKGYNFDSNKNMLTSKILEMDGGLFITGFYTEGEETSWKGVYRIKLDMDFNILEEEYKPLEGNYYQEGLEGVEAYTLKGPKKESQGIIQNSHLEVLENGEMVLTGELYTQFIVTSTEMTTQIGDRTSKIQEYDSDDRSGQRVTRFFSSENMAQITHFYSKIVAFQLSPTGQFTGKAVAIPRKQKKMHISPQYLSYTCTSDGSHMRIVFNDTPDIFDKDYYEKGGFYTGDTGKDQVLQEYILDSDLKAERNVYYKKEELTLVPKATYGDSEGGVLLFSDGKKLYVKDSSID